MNKYTIIGVVVIIVVGLFFVGIRSYFDKDDNNEQGIVLPEQVIQALDWALDDEYKARATYDAVIKKFGDVRPFSNIREAEEKHINSLIGLYKKYNLDIPKSTWDGNMIAPESIVRACADGVQAEINNATLYRDKLLPVVTQYTDITKVFESLMRASQENHLPAFERCS